MVPMLVAVFTSNAVAGSRMMVIFAPGSTGPLFVPVNAAATTVTFLKPDTPPGPAAVTVVNPGARPATWPSVTPALAIVVSPVEKVGFGTPPRVRFLASRYTNVYVPVAPEVIVSFAGPPLTMRANGTAVTNMVSVNPDAVAVTQTGVALNATHFTKHAVRTCGASDVGVTVATPVLHEVTVTGVSSGLPRRSRRMAKEWNESATASVRASSSNVRLFGVPTSAAVGSSLQAATRPRAASAPCRPKIREFMRSSLDGLPAVTQKRWTSCSASGPSNSCQLERLGSRRSSV